MFGRLFSKKRRFLRINIRYTILFFGLLLAEVLIALFVNDQFIRPFLGDVLVVILLFAFLKIFITKRDLLVALSVLTFAVLIEFAQYFKLNELLGLQDYKLCRIILGSTFDPLDLLAYFLGFIVALALPKLFPNNP